MPMILRFVHRGRKSVLVRFPPLTGLAGYEPPQYYACMGKQRTKTRRNVAEIARSVVEQVIGEKLTGKPLDKTAESREPNTRIRPPWRLANCGPVKAVRQGPPNSGLENGIRLPDKLQKPDGK